MDNNVLTAHIVRKKMSLETGNLILFIEQTRDILGQHCRINGFGVLANTEAVLDVSFLGSDGLSGRPVSLQFINQFHGLYPNRTALAEEIFALVESNSTIPFGEYVNLNQYGKDVRVVAQWAVYAPDSSRHYEQFTVYYTGRTVGGCNVNFSEGEMTNV